MSSALTNFDPKEILANGEDANGDFRTILFENDVTSQELDYIPPREMLCGLTNGGQFFPIQVGINGEFLP